MATRAKITKTTAVVTRPASTGALTTLGERMQARVARQREELAKSPKGGSAALSFKGGTISLDGNMLGNSIPVVVLANQFERVYYPAEYSADREGVVPACYSRDGTLAGGPDEGAAYPQAKLCKDCPHNEFGSALQGKGKACKEGMKVALVHADNLDEPSPPVLSARFSVMNTKTVQSDLRGLFAMGIEHTIQAHANLTCSPHPKTQIENHLVFTGFTSPEVVAKLEPLIDDAQASLCEVYPADRADDPSASKPKARAAAPTPKGRRRY